jgi:hypothetical protein
VGDFPLGLPKVALKNELKKYPQNWIDIFNSLSLLSKDGLGLYFVEPMIVSSRLGNDFLKFLEDKEFFVNYIINPPDKLYCPESTFRPIIIGINTFKHTDYFIGELAQENNVSLVSNQLARINSNYLESGILEKRESFTSFQNYELKIQLKNLKTQFNEFEQYKLQAVRLELNTTNEDFVDVPNSIYIHRTGAKEVVYEIKKINGLHKHMFQVVLNPDIVKAEYMCIYFKSEIGQIALNSLKTGSFIPMINKSVLDQCIISIPDKKEQELIVSTSELLKQLQNTIGKRQTDLSINPRNAKQILENYDSVSKPLCLLSAEDDILRLIRKGEGQKIEFKQTFSKDISTNKKNDNVIRSSLKTIVGFLNSRGGTLLIGVSDKGEVTGIEKDLYFNNDRYLLKFKDLLRDRIGVEFFPFIDYDIYAVGTVKVLRVDCKESDTPCFYEDKEFFVRTNPATEKLEGKKQLDYIKTRFPKLSIFEIETKGLQL